ncbi:MAG: hypothetical protein E7323_07355 [Clostridiales bacterium]|nr:hypothetical protein [Clostridiales bacterium]
MAYYAHDPISGRAINAMDKELRQAYRDGLRLRTLRERGLLTPEEAERIRSRYKGISRRRLEAAEQGLLLPHENA